MLQGGTDILVSHPRVIALEETLVKTLLKQVVIPYDSTVSKPVPRLESPQHQRRHLPAHGASGVGESLSFGVKKGWRPALSLTV